MDKHNHNPRYAGFDDASTEGSGGGRTQSQTLTPAQELGAGAIVAERYRVISLLGRGAMGSVYLVEQVFLKKRFALKTLNSVSSGSNALRRFQKEAQAASLLEHPNLVKATDFGVLDDNQPFFVMEYLEGDTLKQHVRQNGALPVDEALELFSVICSAVQYAHEKGIVHRDIKPGNIVLLKSDGGGRLVPKVVDFGIAKLEADHAEALTRTGEVFGTPSYMSPEQCAGHAVDQRSDIYSLGCVLFEVLTGSPPYSADNALEMMMRHKGDPVPTLCQGSLGKQFSAGLEQVVSKMLAKDPLDRFQNCASLKEAIEILRRGGELLLAPAGVGVNKVQPAKTTDRYSYSLMQLLVVGLVCILFTGAVAWVWFASVQRRQRTQSDSATKQPQIEKPSSQPPGTTPAEPRFFSHALADGSKQFVMPDKVEIGVISWWRGGHLRTVRARRTVTVPRGVPVIFELGMQVYGYSPNYLLKFRGDDLSAIIIDPGDDGEMLLDEHRFNQAIHNMKGFNSLKALELFSSTALDQQSLDTIGSFPNLYWLLLKRPETDSSAIARLKNLPQLRVLSLREVVSCTPILSSLAGRTALERLQIDNCEISDEDLSLICKMRSLNVLDLINDFKSKSGLDDAERSHILSGLAKLPELKQMRIERHLLGAPHQPLSSQALSALRRFKQLNSLAINGEISDEELKQVQKFVPSNCKVERKGGFGIGMLFDVAVCNPIDGGLR